jgi:hypothetical protein
MGRVKQSRGTNTPNVRAGLAGVAFATFVVAGVLTGVMPAAAAPPTTDDHGFVDSTARCDPPSRAVAFGYTADSRVAICKDDASGQYQYRGVRISDGARLILDATATSHGYVAENDGITYTVTSSALTVTSGGQQVRNEPMVEFHGTAAGPSSTQTATSSTNSTSSTSAPSTSAGPAQPSAAPVVTTPSTPLPPPLPAEVGGSGH